MENDTKRRAMTPTTMPVVVRLDGDLKRKLHNFHLIVECLFLVGINDPEWEGLG